MLVGKHGSHNINVPPLRERLEDLNILVKHFLEKASKILDKKNLRRLMD